MATLVVVGAGGMGREAAAWLADAGRGSSLVGFVDDDPTLHGTEVAGYHVVGGVSWLHEHPDVEAVLAIGSPQRRGALASELDAADVRLATVVHPSAMVGPRVTIGPGSIVCPGVLLTCDVEVGRAVILNYGAMVGHDTRIGDAAFVSPGVRLAGAVVIGAEADLGIGASVIQGVEIGARAVVGAGAVVIRDVSPATTVVGVPARPCPPKR